MQFECVVDVAVNKHQTGARKHGFKEDGAIVWGEVTWQ